MADGFVEALLIAGKAHLRPDSSLDAAILAVARVALERAAEHLRAEAEAHLGDIKPGDELGAKMAKHAAGCLLTAADDILTLIPTETT